MSDYVGIDVHRKRSQVAVVTGDGTVEFNKNVMNGSEPILRLIGDLVLLEYSGVAANLGRRSMVASGTICSSWRRRLPTTTPVRTRSARLMSVAPSQQWWRATIQSAFR